MASADKQSEKVLWLLLSQRRPFIRKVITCAGVDFDDITDVVLTHLHFDHCGGSVKWNSGKTHLEPVFKNAKYWSHEAHWNHAIKPNAREKASFIAENILPIQESGQLTFVGDDLKISENMSVIMANGHTEKMMCPKIQYQDKTLVFAADMIPSAAHIPPHYAMGYDIRPLVRMDENARFLKEAIDQNYTLFFEHDLHIECATVKQENGKFKADQRSHFLILFNNVNHQNRYLIEYRLRTIYRVCCVKTRCSTNTTGSKIHQRKHDQ